MNIHAIKGDSKSASHQLHMAIHIYTKVHLHNTKTVVLVSVLPKATIRRNENEEASITPKFDGYNISGVKLSIAGSATELNNLNVHIDDNRIKEDYIHGNLGQDFIKQFGKMIISFEHSSILFEQ